MAQNRSLTNAVGIRNGTDMMFNAKVDLDTATQLFDAIPVANGGSAEIAGVWAFDRDTLIQEVTSQIITFQTVNNRPVVDGVIDRGGGTLKLMNSLAASGPAPVGGIQATLVPAPDGREEIVANTVIVAEPGSLFGMRALQSTTPSYAVIRKLVQVEGSSIKWFGVATGVNTTTSCTPHINFTPTPIQGGYSDSTYDTFTGWGQLWDDYTSIIGSQIFAAEVDQVLIIPFYKTSQQRDLGSFMQNWQDVVTAIMNAIFDDQDPLLLRDNFEFSNIVSSSFSNGYVAHQKFNEGAAGAADMTSFVFDLDGQAGGSHWRPQNGVIYLNRPSPMRANPVGTLWYVGERWQNFAHFYGAGFNTHACCRNHLLYHGIMMNCRADVEAI